MSNSLVTNSFKQKKRTSRVSQKNSQSETDCPSTSLHPNYAKEIELLKSFDLNLEYGPCTGISRMERWLRANKHGLNPPKEIYFLLSQHPDDDDYSQCLWKDYQL